MKLDGVGCFFIMQEYCYGIHYAVIFEKTHQTN